MQAESALAAAADQGHGLRPRGKQKQVNLSIDKKPERFEIQRGIQKWKQVASHDRARRYKEVHRGSRERRDRCKILRQIRINNSRFRGK